MHETVIAADVVRQVKKKVGAAKLKSVKAIAIEVGEFAPISAAHLAGTLRELTGWKVRIKAIKAMGKCTCGFSGRPRLLQRGHDFCIYCCPKCGHAPKLKQGGDIKATGIGVAD